MWSGNQRLAQLGLCLAAAAIAVGAASAEPLCDTSKFQVEPDHRYHEEDFTHEYADANLTDLKTLIPDWVDTSRENGGEIDLRSGELWMAYFNRLNALQGYVLRQKALAERAAGESGEDTEAFCNFLSTVPIID